MFSAMSTLPERLPENLIEQYGFDEEGLALYEVKENVEKEDVLEVAEKISKPVSAKKIAGMQREKNITPANEVNIGDLMG